MGLHPSLTSFLDVAPEIISPTPPSGSPWSAYSLHSPSLQTSMRVAMKSLSKRNLLQVLSGKLIDEIFTRGTDVFTRSQAY
jgi:hypothetical protein